MSDRPWLKGGMCDLCGLYKDIHPESLRCSDCHVTPKQYELIGITAETTLQEISDKIVARDHDKDMSDWYNQLHKLSMDDDAECEESRPGC